MGDETREESQKKEAEEIRRRYFTVDDRTRNYGCLVPALAGVGALFLSGAVFFALVVLVALFQTSKPPVFVQNRIAIVHIEGEIGTPAGVKSEEILRTLKRAEEDETVKAVVLRIDSPGGAAASSQEIANFIRKMKKPVVASVGNSAASGAYWVAAACDRIVCNRSSSLGSIGVIVAIPNFEELARKIGIKYVVIYKGRFKDLGNPTRNLTEEEIRLIERQIGEIYEDFINFVSKARKMPREKVEKIATGEVFTGRKAVELGLADRNGDFYDALEEARKLAKIKGKYEIVDYDAVPFYLRKLERLFSLSSEGVFLDFLKRRISVAH